MTKPIIGIAGNERVMIDSDSHWISYVPRNFVDGIQQAGGLPLILPIGDPSDVATYVSQIDKLLLAGGHDVSPKFYGEPPHQKLGDTDPGRDAFEIALVKEALKQGKPIMGVCRGMQLLNVAFGGTVYQDLSLREEETYKHVQLPTPFQTPSHFVNLEKDFVLSAFLPERYEVNSFHHQVLARVAEEFTVMATADDGVVEAIQSKTNKIFGVQWHPELTHQTIPLEQEIFNFFVQQY